MSTGSDGGDAGRPRARRRLSTAAPEENLTPRPPADLFGGKVGLERDLAKRARVQQGAPPGGEARQPSADSMVFPAAPVAPPTPGRRRSVASPGPAAAQDAVAGQSPAPMAAATAAAPEVTGSAAARAAAVWADGMLPAGAVVAPFFCADCGEQQLATVGGMTCPNGHGGADSMVLLGGRLVDAPPSDVVLREAQAKALEAGMSAAVGMVPTGLPRSPSAQAPAAGVGRISFTRGQETYSPVQYQSFHVGPVTIERELRPGDDPVAVGDELRQQANEIARRAYEQQLGLHFGRVEETRRRAGGRS